MSKECPRTDNGKERETTKKKKNRQPLEPSARSLRCRIWDQLGRLVDHLLSFLLSILLCFLLFLSFVFSLPLRPSGTFSLATSSEMAAAAEGVPVANLLALAAAGQLEAVMDGLALVAPEADMNVRRDGLGLLDMAAARGHAGCIRALVARGSSVSSANSAGYTPLFAF